MKDRRHDGSGMDWLQGKQAGNDERDRTIMRIGPRFTVTRQTQYAEYYKKFA